MARGGDVGGAQLLYHTVGITEALPPPEYLGLITSPYLTRR